MKPIAFKILFVITAYYDLDINQINMKIAVFYDLINQLLYIQIPKGLESFANKGIVCKLLKAFYSLKQAPRL